MRILQAMLFISLTLISIHSSSTTFIPLPMADQLRDSDAVIHGVYQGKNFKKLPSGDISTESSFKIISTAGLKHFEVNNPLDFKVIHPGGEWEGVAQLVTGSPQFQKGEEVVLILKKQPWGFSVNNMALGKYKLEKRKGEDFLVSEVFPEHPRIGKLTWKKFNEILLDVKGEKLQSDLGIRQHRSQQNIAYQSDKVDSDLINRAPASNENDESFEAQNAASSDGLGIMGLTLILGLLGAWHTIKSSKKRS